MTKLVLRNFEFILDEFDTKNQRNSSNSSSIENSTLKILSLSEEVSWFKAEFNNTIGYVPKNYIKLEPNLWYFGKIPRLDTERYLLQKDVFKRVGLVCKFIS